MRVFLILLILLLTALPVSAQDTVTTTLSNGVTVTHPAEWTASTDENGNATLGSDNTTVNFFYYSLADLEVEKVKPGDALGMLKAFHIYNLNEGEESFKPGSVQNITVNGTPITYYESLEVLENDEFIRLRGVYALEDGTMIVFSAYPNQGREITEKETVLDIAGTTQYGIYYLADGSSFRFPTGWETYLDDREYIRLDSGITNVRLVFYSPEELTDMGATAKNLVPVLEDGLNSANDSSVTFDESAVTTLRAGAYKVWRYQFIDTYEGEQYERVFWVFMLNDGWVNFLDTAPNAGFEFDETDEQAIVDIIGSFTLPE